jgi:putative FmdB family regulatory protein
MPLYEYKCGSCDSVIEVIQKFSDAPLTTCQSCGGVLQRLVSAPALQFKGSGWYITDYARAGAKGKTNGSAGDGGDGGEKAEKKSEAAPAKSESGSTSSSASSTTKD